MRWSGKTRNWSAAAIVTATMALCGATTMKNNSTIAPAGLVPAGIVPAGTGKKLPGTGDSMPTASLGHDPAAVEHGKYLVTILGCNDCHTPFHMTERGPEPDMSRMLSGHPQAIKVDPKKVNLDASNGGWAFAGNATNTAFVGPWGVTYTANLTPDIMTGLGIWTEETFVSAIRNGKHWGSARPIMPPMPWQWFSKMTDRDLKSIYAFLRTIPPVSNTVPDYEPPAPAPQPRPTRVISLEPCGR